MNDSENSRARRTSGRRRLLHLFLFAMVLEICALMFALAATAQFFFLLVNGEPQPGVRDFGRQLGAYVREIIVFLTGDGEPLPYPLGAWQKEDRQENTDVEN